MRSYIGVLFKKGQKKFLGKKRTQRDNFILIDELERNACHFRYRRYVSKWKIIRPYHFYVEKKYFKDKY